MAECGGEVDHPTLNRWIVKHAPLIAIEESSKSRKRPHSGALNMTNLEVNGK